jgi:hypothetical protein
MGGGEAMILLYMILAALTVALLAPEKVKR